MILYCIWAWVWRDGRQWVQIYSCTQLAAKGLWHILNILTRPTSNRDLSTYAYVKHSTCISYLSVREGNFSFVGLLYRIVSIAKLIWDCIVVGFKLQNPPLDQDFEWLAAIWPLRPDWAVHPYHNPEDEMWMITNFEFEVRSLNFAKNIESENVVVVVQTGRPIGIEVPKCCFARSSSASRLTITMLQMYSD